MKRWNWIDLVIVLVLVAAIAFVALKFTGGEEEAPEASTSTVTATEPDLQVVVSCANITRELAENIIATLESEPRNVEGKLVERTHLLSGTALINGHVTDWEIGETLDNDLVELRLTVEADSLPANNLVLIGVQEVRIGRSFFVKTVDIEIEGIIVSITELSK